MTLFSKLTDREGDRLMFQNNHLVWGLDARFFYGSEMGVGKEVWKKESPFLVNTSYNGKPQAVQFSSVTQTCPTLCYPMHCSTPNLPVHHQLPEFT